MAKQVSIPLSGVLLKFKDEILDSLSSCGIESTIKGDKLFVDQDDYSRAMSILKEIENELS